MSKLVYTRVTTLARLTDVKAKLILAPITSMPLFDYKH